MFSAVLELEWVGYNSDMVLRSGGNMAAASGHPGAYLLGSRPIRRPWVCRIRDAYDLPTKRFLRGDLDFSGADSVGSRGVKLVFLLEPGTYRVRTFTTWRHEDRYIFHVTENGETSRLSDSDLAERDRAAGL